MLHFKSRQGSAQSNRALTSIGTLVLFLFTVSCGKGQAQQLEADPYAQYLTQLYESNTQSAQQQFSKLLADYNGDSSDVDRPAVQYYRNGGQWLWMGTPEQLAKADTLFTTMQAQVDSMGFSRDYFLLSEIQPLLEQMHQPDSVENLPETMAQLEYKLSKAYTRYALGQRFGFTNPVKLFGKNNYDTQIEKADSAFFNQLFSPAADAQAVADLLASVEPHDSAYQLFKKKLATDTTDAQRFLTLCNMERRRWRNVKQPEAQPRYIFVNIAAQEVWAIGGDTVNNMRVCCGKASTKSPLLTSEINKIEFNPEWGIPQSIIRGEVSGHAGDPSYFSRRNYYITNSSGQKVDPSTLTPGDLASGRYAVRQRSGAGNALGRIIFRFPNRFSVYLHHTSSPGAFNKAQRTVSHGCIRLQRPFEIAEFVLEGEDEWKIDQMRLSIDMEPKTEQGKEYKRTHRGAIRLVSSTPVEPVMPVVIDYYTLFPNPKTGDMETWGDPYGYDKIIQKAIKPFLP